MKPPSKKLLRTLLIAAVVIFAGIYFLSLPVVEVEQGAPRDGDLRCLRNGADRAHVRHSHVRAQNTGFIQLADSLSAGRGAIGKTLKKGELLATIADETTARQLKQARADLEAAKGTRANSTLPSSEPLKIAEANVERLEKLTSLSNVPAVEYEKAKSEASRLRDAARRRKESNAIATSRSLDERGARNSKRR